MGYNTIAFLLNDMMHELEKSPHAVTFALTHPPMSDHEREIHAWRYTVDLVAKDNNEPYIHTQALNVLATFHASETTYLRAGGNCIERLNVVRYGKTKNGKNTITLELPDWWDRKRHG